ncbi:hypothetical protein J3458_003016 [Metarhizium acridum]|uniref:uncharacterized protein n=1 Tax=Metarhizium acridum TaxID=92637 RepID=UPI001C6C1C95|nr:hypothetical protein J3458_003016 [Metarhizium acridum]
MCRFLTRRTCAPSFVVGARTSLPKHRGSRQQPSPAIKPQPPTDDFTQKHRDATSHKSSLPYPVRDKNIPPAMPLCGMGKSPQATPKQRHLALATAVPKNALATK